ncbi:hypothetical protein PspS04_22055 [Pseudomonas sp. S04]|uniref:DUF4350 domain-containing protein n=1 Tax=unclassified Pseudomonas TaxID=196821 RepID=UPI00131F5719|nr:MULTISPECIES: DUF4350 domain-containing protein [unclassified Pseudomonas]QHD02872.1 hypothetical protein PspS04_22055 [Pseudomonas sp. S04]QHF35356.1 hypothetical protein PspS19_22065 [Pseudomonas sp. S19]
MNRLQMVLGTLLAGLLAAVAVYLFLQATPYAETIDHGPSPEAQANPYLAAEHFLRQQGLRVSHANSLETLPPLPSRQHSLLLLGERVDMTPAQVEKVLAWAHAGGRLLLVAEALWDAKAGKSADLLLDRVQVQQSMSKDLKEPPPEATTDPYPTLTKLYLEDEQAPAYASFDPQFHLEDPHNLAQAWANSALATHMMQLPYGEGLITVITDADLWKNPNIGHYDNAWLLWYLNADTEVTLLFDIDHDHLLTLLLRYFPQALVALAALLGLWCWHVGWRQGPLIAPATKARRQLQEHVGASADFLLRNAGQHSLLQGLQHDVQRRARQRHPGLEQLETAEQWQVIARLTGHPADTIGQLLAPLAKRRLSSSEFSRQVAHLQTLRNAL